MLSLFKRPVEKETLDSWAKMCDDIAKVAILAEPVVIFGNSDTLTKIANGLMLLVAIYIFLNAARKFRLAKNQQED